MDTTHQPTPKPTRVKPDATQKTHSTQGRTAADKFKDALQRINAICDPALVQAIHEGARRLSRKEVLAFAALTDEEMRNLGGLLRVGCTFIKAYDLRGNPLLPRHKAWEFINRAASNGGKFEQVVKAEETGSDWHFTVQRVPRHSSTKR